MKTEITMKLKYFSFAYVLLSAILSSCGGSTETTGYICDCDERKQLQSFVKESIQPANNMNDEEMEDVIRQLRIDGIKIFCKQKPVWIKRGNQVDWTKQKADSCQFIMMPY